jgi:tRNA pseudouridine13 synthase
MPNDTQSAFEKEKKILDAAREQHPEQFVALIKSPYAIFEHTGIKHPPRNLPKGYFKYRPEDFIVEEIRPDGTIVTVDGCEAKREEETGEGTVYFDLTKVGFSTLDAGNRIAELTGYDAKNIGYAGIKDAVAITSQRMSIRGGVLNEILLTRIPGTIIRNAHEAKGVVQIGALRGNRFTLLLRTQDPLDANQLDERIKTILQRGVMNYFGTQRFGTPRFVAHEIGRAMLVGGAQAGVKLCITKTSQFDLPYFKSRRARLLELWGDWRAMRESVSDLPYSFRHELDMLTALERTNGLFSAAIEAVGQQAGMWVRAYASFAANEILSEAESSGRELPEQMPQLLSPDANALLIYKNILDRDGLRNPMSALKRYPFIRVGRNPTFAPIIHPDIHSYKIIPEGLAICFSLPKGAYATTVLMYLIDSATGYPVPDWVDTKFVDTKEVLGMGTLKEVREKLGEDIERLMSRKNEESEAEA